MDEFWDKFKKGAKEVGDKTAKLARITALQAEIATLNGSKNGKFADIGKKCMPFIRKIKFLLIHLSLLKIHSLQSRKSKIR